MSQKTLIHSSNYVQIIDTQNSSFIQAKNKLIASAKKHVKNNGIKSNILAVLSSNDYVHYTNQDKALRLLRKKKGFVGFNSTLDGNSMNQSKYSNNINIRTNMMTNTRISQIKLNNNNIHQNQKLHIPMRQNNIIQNNNLRNNTMQKKGKNNGQVSTQQVYVKQPTKYLNHNEIIVICNNHKGGSIKFINDIINHYKVTIKFVKKKNELLSYKLSNSSIILIQSFLFTDLNVDIIIDTYNRYNCKIIIPIHDWYWFIFPYINNYSVLIHKMYLSNNFTIPEKTKRLFSICDKIICPSKFVHDIIYSKLSTNTNIYLQEWIDYNYTEYINDNPNVLPIHNNVINIGILHAVDEYKGMETIKYLHHRYNSYNNYTIKYLIPGVNIDKYNETELFTHIERYNIHGLLHLNKWGETYCYSLTKSLMSGLPILYNDIGSFKTRIPHLNKYIRNISHESDYFNNSLLQKTLNTYLDYIINNNGTYKKTNFNFNFKSNLLFDATFSDLNKMINRNITLHSNYIENLVVITSKIHCSNNKFTYSNTRSIYSSEQRLNDTLKTIESIRRYIPNSKILLIDNSLFTPSEYETLNKALDIFLHRNSISDIDFYTNICSYKAFGEISQIIQINKFILLNNINFKNMFKISGRYLVNENFNIDSYKVNKNVMKKAVEVKADNYYYTSFYKIYYEHFQNFARCINLLMSNESILKNKDSLGLEQHIYSIIKDDTLLINTLGVTQNIAVWDQKNNI
jgi:hypothetical protein